MSDMSELIPGPEAVIRYVRYQEDVIRQLKAKGLGRDNVIKNQDEALNEMYKENLSQARTIDYYRLVTGLLVIALALCILL